VSGAIIVKTLEATGTDQVSRFRLLDAENVPLVRFIRRDALKSAKANLTQTYVAKLQGNPKVLAYVSVMCAEVAFEQSYSITDKVGADRYEYQPAIRIARLAVDEATQKSGLGRVLVRFVIGIAQQSIQPLVGCRFVLLDAKTGSVTFYERMGFRLLDTDANRNKETPLMFLDLQELG
jgi:predicted N-acetyltransferase YhbS